jgi:hypothetical protein
LCRNSGKNRLNGYYLQAFGGRLTRRKKRAMRHSDHWPKRGRAQVLLINIALSRHDGRCALFLKMPKDGEDGLS